MAQSSPRFHHQIILGIAVYDNSRQRQLGLLLRRWNNLQSIMQLNGIKYRLYIVITIGTTGYDTQPQINFCIGKSNHLYLCFSRIFAKITILSHIGNSTLKKNKNFIEEKIYYNFTGIIEKQKQMKKRTLTAGTILLCLSAISFGQNYIKDFLHQNPQFFGSTASVYYCNDTIDTPAPKDFIPFHIDHIARHGSRTHD